MKERSGKKVKINNISLLITIILFVALFSFGAVRYDRFLSLSTLFNLINDNSYLIIAAIGVTFVLLTGGIDISIASTIAFTCVLSAYMLKRGVPAPVVIALVLIIGLLLGASMGYIIHYFKLQPFIVTLAGCAR